MCVNSFKLTRQDTTQVKISSTAANFELKLKLNLILSYELLGARHLL